jgi:hypothetical protein
VSEQKWMLDWLSESDLRLIAKCLRNCDLENGADKLYAPWIADKIEQMMFFCGAQWSEEDIRMIEAIKGKEVLNDSR